MKLSENFTLEELINSSTAKRKGIDNTPSPEEEESLQKLATTILQPIREKYGKPLVVSSGYRGKALNKLVGGSTSSQHMLGEAADIHTLSDLPEENKELFDMILGMMESGELIVGQLIDEYGYNWVHVSLPKGNKINQVLHIK